MKTLCVVGLFLLVSALPSRAVDRSTLRTGVQSLPGALPGIGAKALALDWNFDLTEEKFLITVPTNYSTNRPSGIFVFLSPSDAMVDVPPGWADVLQKKRLVLIAPQKVGNEQPVSRRAGLAVLSAAKLTELVPTDTNRIYVAGFSGGARIASYVSFLRPNLFTGVFAICGAGFPRVIARVKATKDDDYGHFTSDNLSPDEAKKNVRFVLVTGVKDFRYGNILDIYEGGFRKDGYAAKLMDIPGMEHTMCTAKALSDGITFLDDRPKVAAAK